MNSLFLLREIGFILKKRLTSVIVFCTMFVIGIMCGIVIEKSVTIYRYYLNYCDNYIYRIFSESPSGILLDRVLSSAFFLLLTIPTAFCIFYLPVQALLIFYKGFIFGTVTVILISVYKFSGFLVWLIILLPQTLLFAAVYICFSVIAYDFVRERRCRGTGIKELFTYFLIALLSSLVCALIEFLLVCLIFRPVSKVL